ncbi:membrane hypothetical protein [Paraburkholderia piptadeniae]|uniref:Transmembrane protein n=1 Tax=Paraburkholderia piptadeniae TaxID=1701573 RepID=A0A1N7SJ81_9BURK|nr:membrane hypothetical protein [Paraburkholderia piptadeniae]
MKTCAQMFFRCWFVALISVVAYALTSTTVNPESFDLSASKLECWIISTGFSHWQRRAIFVGLPWTSTLRLLGQLTDMLILLSLLFWVIQIAHGFIQWSANKVRRERLSALIKSQSIETWLSQMTLALFLMAACVYFLFKATVSSEPIFISNPRSLALNTFILSSSLFCAISVGIYFIASVFVRFK